MTHGLDGLEEAETMCEFRMGSQQCDRPNTGASKLCVYHHRGGKKLWEGSFFSFTHMSTVDPRYHKAVKGDVRTDEDQEVCAVFDGRSWRRLCPQCPALARPIYCIRHSNGSKQRSMACECFDALEGELNIKIAHAHWTGSDGEVRIPGTAFRVDGYVPHTNQVFEFLGDYYHANPDLFPAQEIHPFSKVPCHEVYQSTMGRIERIRGLGYHVRYIWEKDFKTWKVAGGSLLEYFQ